MPPPNPPKKPAVKKSSSLGPALLLLLLGGAVAVYFVPSWRTKAIDLYHQAYAKVTGKKAPAPQSAEAPAESGDGDQNAGLSRPAASVAPVMMSADGSDPSAPPPPPPQLSPEEQALVRTWTDSQGRTVEAKFVRLENDEVVIQRVSDGREFKWRVSRLSKADQDWIKEQRAKQ